LANPQKLVLAAGAIAAVLLAVIIGMVIGKKDPHPPEPPAAQSGLQVSVNAQPPLNAAKPLRCFVNGQMVGMATLADCAQKNGVSAQALDVGVDASGSLTAAQTASLTPPPTPPRAPPPAAEAPPAAPVEDSDQGAPAPCLHYVGSEWRPVADSLSLNACIRAMFAGKCVRPGQADYGRWGDTTLRHVPAGVEQSSDNRRFHVVLEQSSACDAGTPPPAH
jgi:hypothetical protein